MEAPDVSQLQRSPTWGQAPVRAASALCSPGLLGTLLALAVLGGLCAGYVVDVVGLQLVGRDDFTAYWNGAVGVAAGRSPYSWLAEHPEAAEPRQDYVYPPLLAVLLAPLTHVLDYPSARWGWLAFSGLCLTLGWALAWRASGLARHWRSALSWLPFLALLPWATIALGLGQVSPQLVLLVAAALTALESHRPRAAGVLFASAASLKAFPGLLGGYLLLRRQWSAGLAALGAGVLGLGGTLLALGWEPHWAYLTEVPSAQHWMLGRLFNYSLVGVFTRLFIPTAFASPVMPSAALGQATIVTSILAVLAATGYVAWRAPRDSAGEELAYALVVAAMLLLAPINGPYNLVIAMVPLAAATARVQATCGRHRGWLVAILILLFSPLGLGLDPPLAGWATFVHAAPVFGLLGLWVLLVRLGLESDGTRVLS
jgi:Glycosyltransferase family 87